MIPIFSNFYKLGFNKLNGKIIALFYNKHYKFTTEDILRKNFSKGMPFSFIQIGGNDGVSFDFLYDFVIERKSKGIIIEPVPTYYRDLFENYKNFDNIITINKAVHPIKKSEFIYKIKDNVLHKYPDWAKGIASFDRKHLGKAIVSLPDDDVEGVEVVCDTLMSLTWPQIQHIDYLQIDTEGFDYEVLKQIDFKKFSPSIIKYERVNLNKEELIGAYNLLRNEGYFCFTEGIDGIAVNLKKIRL